MYGYTSLLDFTKVWLYVTVLDFTKVWLILFNTTSKLSRELSDSKLGRGLSEYLPVEVLHKGIEEIASYRSKSILYWFCTRF